MCIAAHLYGIRAVPGIYGHVPADRLNGDLVSPFSSRDSGSPIMRALNCERVVSVPQFETQGLQVPVPDAARQFHASDNRIRPHAQAVEVIFGQNARIVGRTVAVKDVQAVHLILFIHPHVGINGSVEVIMAYQVIGVNPGIRPGVLEGHRVILYAQDLHDRSRCRSVKDGKLIVVPVHARVEPVLVCSFLGIHMRGARPIRRPVIGQGGMPVNIRRTVDLSVGHIPVVLSHQGKWVTDETLFADTDAAFNGERTTDVIHPLGHSRIGNGVTAVDHIVVDRGHPHGLRIIPSPVRVEKDLRRHSGVSLAARQDRELQSKLRPTLLFDCDHPGVGRGNVACACIDFLGKGIGDVG